LFRALTVRSRRWLCEVDEGLLSSGAGAASREKSESQSSSLSDAALAEDVVSGSAAVLAAAIHWYLDPDVGDDAVEDVGDEAIDDVGDGDSQEFVGDSDVPRWRPTQRFWLALALSRWYAQYLWSAPLALRTRVLPQSLLGYRHRVSSLHGGWSQPPPGMSMAIVTTRRRR
jgi:hypothetical protein